MNEQEAKQICKCLAAGTCQKKCRQHIDYPSEHNCTLVSVEINGEMTLRQVAERMGISHVRVMQLENGAIKKMQNRIKD